jgi:hypothetical protein
VYLPVDRPDGDAHSLLSARSFRSGLFQTVQWVRHFENGMRIMTDLAAIGLSGKMHVVAARRKTQRDRDG